MSPSESIHHVWARVSKLVIRHPQFSQARDVLCDAFKFSQETGLAKNYLLVGSTGVGKTTLLNSLLREFPAKETKPRSIRPIVAAPIPAMPTIKNLAEQILVTLGDENFYRGSAIDKTNRILIFLRECHCHMLIFDEMHHFIDRGHKRAPADVADWLKTVIDQAQVSTVLIGLERTEIILEANEQLRRRFTKRLELNPFELDNPVDRANFAGIIQQVDKTLKLNSPLNLTSDLIRQIHYATNGIIDYTIRLMLEAYQICIQNNLPGISLLALEQAFSNIWADGINELNPFNPKFIYKRLDQRGMIFYTPQAALTKRKVRNA